MSDLYTSQVHLKRLLAGQATPAFTPAPDAVLKMLDPAFFPGMGALNEDEHGRLQCPVRGCGQWHYLLSQHLRRRHPTIGAATFRQSIGLSKRTPLCSRAVTNRMKVSSAPSLRAARSANPGHRPPPRVRGTKMSIGARNWANTCPAQTATKITELSQKIGHTPTLSEFIREYKMSEKTVYRVFSSWGNAKALAGISPSPQRGDQGCVVESLSTWVTVHGDLPSSTDCRDIDRAPRVPSHITIMKAFGVDNWHAAMRSAAEHLSIKSERYGFDFRRKGAA